MNNESKQREKARRFEKDMRFSSMKKDSVESHCTKNSGKCFWDRAFVGGNDEHYFRLSGADFSEAAEAELSTPKTHAKIG